jgi:clan AA aspartic protease
MAEEKGVVNENLEAVVEVKLQNGAMIEGVLDTGFNGSLLLPRKFAGENSMLFLGLEQVELVEEISVEIETALAEISWLGEDISIRIYISDTGDALIGTEMLIDSVLEIDYKNLMVKITK